VIVDHNLEAMTETTSEERSVAEEPCSRGSREQVEVLKRSKLSKCNKQRSKEVLEKVLRREPEKYQKV